jgi:hypothetical protein
MYKKELIYTIHKKYNKLKFIGVFRIVRQLQIEMLVVSGAGK